MWRVREGGMCCADEAALCRRVHAANNLDSTLLHLPPPCCDVCQERTGYFFCLEDRALLCRSCDYSIHSVNALAGKHKWLLVAGIQVDLQALTNNNVDEVKGYSSSHVSSTVSQAKPVVVNSVPVSGINHIGSAGMVHVQCESRVSSSLKTSAPGPDQVSQELSVAQVVPSSALVLPPLNSTDQQIHFSSEWGMQRVHSQNSKLAGLHRGDNDVDRRSSISEYLTETIPG